MRKIVVTEERFHIRLQMCLDTFKTKNINDCKKNIAEFFRLMYREQNYLLEIKIKLKDKEKYMVYINDEHLFNIVIDNSFKVKEIIAKQEELQTFFSTTRYLENKIKEKVSEVDEKLELLAIDLRSYGINERQAFEIYQMIDMLDSKEKLRFIVNKNKQ